MDALILSNALDTNGQNARYVKASQRWGTDDGVVKALVVGNYDPASVMERFRAASEKLDTLTIRSAHRQTHIYQSMPADIVWSHRNHREIRQLAIDADIIHLNNSTIALKRLNLNPTGKGIVLHHHGSMFRSDPKHMIAEAHRFRAVQAVSTIDLAQVAPSELHWLPTAYDVDWLEAFGDEHRREPDGRIRVVSAPTNRAFKQTDELEAAVSALQAEGLPIDLVLIWNKPWIECMALKATADIYFDQAVLGYGCNAVEAWGMGIPVIAGGNPWTLATMKDTFGQIPFVEATPTTIGEAIRKLLTKKARSTWANRGRKHVRRFHDERPALLRLAELYHMALSQPYERQGQGWADIPPATFTGSTPQIRVGNQLVTFSNGPVTIDNPHIASRIRQYALRHPNAEIVEVA